MKTGKKRNGSKKAKKKRRKSEVYRVKGKGSFCARPLLPDNGKDISWELKKAKKKKERERESKEQ